MLSDRLQYGGFHLSLARSFCQAENSHKLFVVCVCLVVICSFCVFVYFVECGLRLFCAELCCQWSHCRENESAIFPHRWDVFEWNIHSNVWTWSILGRSFLVVLHRRTGVTQLSCLWHSIMIICAVFAYWFQVWTFSVIALLTQIVISGACSLGSDN